MTSAMRLTDDEQAELRQTLKALAGKGCPRSKPDGRSLPILGGLVRAHRFNA